MSVIDKSVKVASSPDAILAACADIVKVSKQVTKDGFQAGQDMPPILSASVMALVHVVGEFQQLPGDAKEHTVEFVRACLLGGADIVEAALS